MEEVKTDIHLALKNVFAKFAVAFSESEEARHLWKEKIVSFFFDYEILFLQLAEIK